MLAFVRRLLTLMLFMAAAALMARMLFEFIPGDKARLVLGEQATEAEITAYNHLHGYDQPLPARLGNYLRGLSRLELGNSDIEGGKNQPVTAILL